MTSSAESPVEAEFHRALTLHRQARIDEARILYEQVLQRQPRHVQALTFLSVIAYESKEPERTLELSAKALAVDPRSAASHLMHGHAQLALRRFEAAVASYDRAIALESGLADAYIHRGNALIELGRHAAAVESYDKALAVRAHGADIHHNRGLALCAVRRHEAALASYNQAIAIDPHHAEAYFSRANVLQELQRLDAALSSYDQAIALRPDHAMAHSNRGNVLSELRRFDAALAGYDAAISLQSDYADAHCNRGNLLADLRRFGDALQSFDRAVAAAPGYAHAYFSRSLVRLLLGDFENGWRDFEWRWQSEHSATSREKRIFSQPLWLGGESLRGKTLLLHCEQGLGDTIQFCRYAELVADLGARVIFEAPAALASLLESLRGVAQWVVRGAPLPPFDYHCPLLSLPLALRTTLQSVPAQVPYLRSGPERVRHWQDRLGARTRPRVGLVWSGGIRPPQLQPWSAVNKHRNIPLAKLAPLEDCGVELYSLQKGQPAESELAELAAKGGPAIVDYSSELHDFADTAALMQQLDLIISVDTSTAHLAGALGRPVWILNRFDTCWRWLLDRSDSPWYPTARLYRQESGGDWDGVVARVRRDLAAFAGQP